jgi:nitrite reductase (NADH) small subunit
MTELLNSPAGSERVGDGDGAPGWQPVCRYEDLLPERGAAALVAGRQVALFRCHDGSVHAVGQRDPFSGANVMSRGIVGTRGDLSTVASPMFKQVFDLGTGVCLDSPEDAPVRLPVYRVRVSQGIVEVEAGPGGEDSRPDATSDQMEVTSDG